VKRERLNSPVPAANVLGQLLNQYGLMRAYSRHQVVHLWPKIVNPTIARHARVERITGNTIYLAVDSSVWMNEMAALKQVLLLKINACLSSDAARFEEIRFVQRSSVSPPQESQPPEKEYLLNPREQQKVRSLLEPLRNEDIKSLMNRIIEKDIQLKNSRERKNKRV
jgi:hypothetical protein